MYTQCTGNIKFCYVNFEFIYSVYFHWGIIGTHFLYVSHVQKFFVYILYRVMTTKTLFSVILELVVHYYRAGSTLPYPFPSGNQYSTVCLHVFDFVWFAHLFTVCLYLYSTYLWNHSVPVFLCLTYFTLYKTL